MGVFLLQCPQFQKLIINLINHGFQLCVERVFILCADQLHTGLVLLYLKLVDLSPAHDLVELTLSWLSVSTIVTVLGVCEVILGLMFLVPKLTKITLVLFVIHMAGTFIPIVGGLAVAYTAVPYGLTLVGQYIIKNLVFLAAGAGLWYHWKNPDPLSKVENNKVKETS